MSALTLIALGVAALAIAAAVVLALKGGGRSAELALRLDQLSRDLERVERGLRADVAAGRDAAAGDAKGLREEVASTLKTLSEVQRGGLDGFSAQVTRLTQTLEQRLESFARQMAETARTAEARQESLRQTVEQRLGAIQADNAQRLEQMRQTVDEKLQGTLEKRLGESFKLVSERLELVHQGLGEMQSLASGVGDLKKVLTNVKTRGIWGEVQLGNLLEQVLTPDQYLANAACREGSAERVEFVIRLPGKGDDGEEVWLPIDAKFPDEDYQRLRDAADAADPERVEQAAKALEVRIKGFAKDIYTKYVNPPRTTAFAILFLPTEGLYAEVLRRPGLAEALHRDFRVTLCGPSTLTAFLNSLQMGFQTLAIQKRSSEAWRVLGAVKTEFAKYGEVLDKVRQKLGEASDQIDKIDVRKRAIDRKLRAVTEVSSGDAQKLLELDPTEE